jgi:hypothetical protein
MNPKTTMRPDDLRLASENEGMTNYVDRVPRETRASPVRRVRTVLVSACLLGEPVRYDGSAAPIEAEAMDRWREKAQLVPFCPEIAAGMPVPRNPAEIRGRRSLDQDALVPQRLCRVVGRHRRLRRRGTAAA